ncbi:hypothetical protein GUJ93_ZPchr0006g46021 [Zizania palustris]|uniref:Transcription factor CBF/NF-Y/archaeal histone domain-containing protein n=1 Tax=Zizania palustris TaxID=103762 RepID=A0A8J5SHE5_ZIZPA|nr:hypothetical protein GUJ93_ZPchr0006g46021 [Zizania palustris]
MGGGSKKQRGASGGGNGKGEEEAAGLDGEAGRGVIINNNKLPIANLVRLMKKVIPGNAKIEGKAKVLAHDCAVEFVGFVGDEASEKTKVEHRRTIAPEDYVSSLHTLGFDNYAEPMANYIHGYREFERAGGNYRRVAPLAAAAAAAGAPVTFTEAELQFLRSVIPSPSDEDSNGSSSPAEDDGGNGYGAGDM